ncbi:PTS system galactitol-specific enzyme IIB component [Listeria fleischmannii FSL S10-1203]|uniref:PTS system galactitol-specific enzyme IIB component n=1 Tax=Listeria fleischmannii FSL S10-1203 TaxID=1265822 RepID=W7DVQ1_9LIST|nr:PTS system galactitol-specific enzyme IIB component [Listeria fleischmannii FSL S10-1203]
MKMIFILGIQEPQNQVPLLAKIMEKFGDETFSKKLSGFQDKREMVRFFKKNNLEGEGNEKSYCSLWIRRCNKSNGRFKSRTYFKKKKGVVAVVEAVDIKSLEQHIKTSDVYIAITKANKTFDIPTLNGIAFLTGMGMEEETTKLLAALK